MALVDELPHQMPLGDVCGFVSHYAGEFILVARRQKQAAVNGNETARHRKRIEHGILQHEVVELMLTFLGMARQAVADLLNVIADLRILDDLPGLTDLGEPPQSGAIFILEGDGGRRRASQIRQILIDGARAGPETCGPADADARAQRCGGRECGQGLQQ